MSSARTETAFIDTGRWRLRLWLAIRITPFHRFAWNIKWTNGTVADIDQTSIESKYDMILSIITINGLALNSSHVHQVLSSVGHVFRTHSLFLLAHCQNFRFLSSLFPANMVCLYSPPDHCRRGRLEWFCDCVHNNSVPDYADTTRS
jgi:hypothetical protein